MPYKQVLSFVAHLIFSQKRQSLITFLSIFIASISLLLFTSFALQVQHIINNFFDTNNLNTVIVSQKSSELFSLKANISEADVNKIESEEGVSFVSRQKMLVFPNTIYISLGMRVSADMFFYGVEENILPEYKLKDINNIPIFISPHLLDAYNMTVPQLISLAPKFTEENIIGTEIDVDFGNSSFLPDHLESYFGAKDIVHTKAEIVAVTNLVPASGFSIPLQKAQEINEKVLGQRGDEFYSQIFVRTEDQASFGQLKNYLAEENYIYRDLDKKAKETRKNASIFKYIIVSIAAIIFLIALFSLFSSLENVIIKEEKNIGILKSMGLSAQKIMTIFLSYAMILTLTASFLAMLLAQIIMRQSNQLVSEKADILILQNGIFNISFYLSLVVLAIIALFVILSILPLLLRIRKKSVLSLLWE